MKFAGLMPSGTDDDFSNIASRSSSGFDMNALKEKGFGDELEIEDVNIDLGDDDNEKRNRVISLDSDE